MRVLVQSIRGEFVRYKQLADRAMAQVSDEQLLTHAGSTDNSIAIICRHIAGNFLSRFTDFLTTDGEKPWRNREEEFDERAGTRADVVEHWDRGWSVLLASLDALTDADLTSTVTIRRQPLQVHEALHRSLAHVAYHVGQIVYLAKAMRGDDWRSLSIPRGMSAAYNKNPDRERVAGVAGGAAGAEGGAAAKKASGAGRADA